MEKLVVTRRKGGSFESRSLQACPLQPRHASQREKSNRNGVGIPLERGSKWPASPAQRCDWHNERIPHRNGSQSGGRSVTVSTQREQAIVEPEDHDVWGTHQPLHQPRTASSIEVCAKRKQVVHQELDRAELAWSSSRQHEVYADSRMARQDQATRRNQAEDQECVVHDLLAWGSLGTGRKKSDLRSGRDTRSPRGINRSPAEQSSLDHTCNSPTGCRQPGSRAAAASRGNDGTARCGYRSKSIGIDRTEVEERGLGHGNSSVPICVRRRRIEGNKEQEQRSALSRACLASAPAMARPHALSLGRRWDFCQSALPWHYAVHPPNPLPPSH